MTPQRDAGVGVGGAGLVRIALAVAAAGMATLSCGPDDPVPDEVVDAATTVPTIAPTTPDDPGPSSPTTSAAAPAPAPTSTSTTTTLPPAGDPTRADVTLELVTELDQPIDAVVAPNGEWWIAERPGRIVEVDPTSGEIGDTVLDVTEETRARGERGLLGVAVDETALYVNFTDGEGNTRVDAFLLDAGGRPADRVPLLSVAQPFGNHNGGSLAIGPDGRLYIGVGDGGGGGDPLGAGQDPTLALGSILRVEPTPGADQAYVIPADNPFGADGTVAEIFLTGVRNPWRFSFDPITGDLWVADVGQNAWEEITLLLGADGWGLGANLGWNLREGVERFSGDRPDGNVDPVFVYGRTGTPSGCSITGGEVYRGTAIPALSGAYVFGDYCTAELWAISVETGSVVFADLEAGLPGGELVDFSVDPDGELVALSLGGAVVRIVPR